MPGLDDLLYRIRVGLRKYAGREEGGLCVEPVQRVQDPVHAPEGAVFSHGAVLGCIIPLGVHAQPDEFCVQHDADHCGGLAAAGPNDLFFHISTPQYRLRHQSAISAPVANQTSPLLSISSSSSSSIWIRPGMPMIWGCSMKVMQQPSL